MRITEIKVFVVEEEKLRGYVTLVLDDCFVIRDVKVIQGTTGLFVAMPSKKRKDGSFKDIAHPLNQDTRAYMEKAILDAFKQAVAQPELRAKGCDENEEQTRTE